MRSIRSLLRAASLTPRLQRAAGGCALWAIAGIAAAASAATADDARAWLTRTDQALATSNYEGVFVHEHAGESETLRVIHRVSAAGVSERLLSMDGSGREFIRRGAELICYLPDQQTVLVERSPDVSLLLGGVPRSDAISAGQYEVKALAAARVSGRAARVIAITPLDGLRYGYRVWIDEATALPLKTQLRDSRGGVLEQIVFTSLTVPAHIADAELQTTIDARNYRWLRHGWRHDRNALASVGVTPSWQASALPPGFRMLVSSQRILHGAPVEHLVFSDGLASVSVFIEPGPAGSAGMAGEDIANLGSSSAYATVVQGYRIIAVGEVPPQTVRAIAQAMHSAAPAPGVVQAQPGVAASGADGGAAGAGGTVELPIMLNDPVGAYRGMTPAPSAVSEPNATSKAAFGASGGMSEVMTPASGGFGERPAVH
jgi:sigma-E factor negative regulatory protein RseB